MVDAYQAPVPEDQGEIDPNNLTLLPPDQYEAMTGESLLKTLDIGTWDTGVQAITAFERLEREMEEAERLSSDLRRSIRENIFGLIKSDNSPAEAGVYSASATDIKEAQLNVLFNGQVEACDANSHVFHTLPV